MERPQTFQDPRLSRWQSAVAAAFGQDGSKPTPALAAASAAAARFAHWNPGDPLPVQVGPPPDTSTAEAEVWRGAGGGADANFDPISYCAHLYLALVCATGAQKEAIESHLGQFGVCDVRWAEALRLYFESEDRPVPYRPPDESQTPALDALPEQLTIGLISDWGTGTAAAAQVLDQVAGFREPGRPFLLIHLGDIYYSGSSAEVQSFVDRCRRRLGPDVPVFTLSGNHDMYSGGEPYYHAIATLNPPPFRQETSYFSLRNRYWQIQAMDTGLHDRDPFQGDIGTTFLEPAEIRWHNRLLKEAASRKVILLSHHQPFSAFVPVGQQKRGWLWCALVRLLGVLARWFYGARGGHRPVGAPLHGLPGGLDQKNVYRNQELLSAFDGTSPHGDGTNYLKQITAWLWGHEHKTIIYKEYAAVKRGRCIGSGAIPVTVDQQPYASQDASIPWVESTQLDHDGTLYYHGFAVLRLDGPAGTLAYYQYPDPNSRNPLFEEDL